MLLHHRFEITIGRKARRGGGWRGGDLRGLVMQRREGIPHHKRLHYVVQDKCDGLMNYIKSRVSTNKTA